MKITDDMLTEEQRSAVEIALSLIGLSSDPRVQKAYKGLRSLLTGRRTTPDRERIQCSNDACQFHVARRGEPSTICPRSNCGMLILAKGNES
ncbi:hypothetical protein [Burkholderia multivorans]|uniref:hypothetical protein n=1 Tax=Burkholderia multivorans TaxID=87883 RepID=UPI001C2655E6|nr:hypothetical protein [Burkholderia multivorans]MBU9566276.1 hypothetical protein [Burkholderia multivorans]